MCNCEGCKIRDYCKLDPDLYLNDAEQCYQLKNAEIIEVSQNFVDDSYRNFRVINK